MTELALAYNQTDGAGIAKIRQKLADAQDGQDDSPSPDYGQDERDSLGAVTPPRATLPAGQPDLMGALQALIAANVPKASGIDEAATSGLAHLLDSLRQQDCPAFPKADAA